MADIAYYRHLVKENTHITETKEYKEYLEGDDAYRDAVGDVPSTEDEQGSWEWNDEWYDKLEEWYDKELVFFQEESKELKEEYIDS